MTFHEDVHFGGGGGEGEDPIHIFRPLKYKFREDPASAIYIDQERRDLEKSKEAEQEGATQRFFEAWRDFYNELVRTQFRDFPHAKELASLSEVELIQRIMTDRVKIRLGFGFMPEGGDSLEFRQMTFVKANQLFTQFLVQRLIELEE